MRGQVMAFSEILTSTVDGGVCACARFTKTLAKKTTATTV